MAIQQRNAVMKGISGKVGDLLILKQYSYGTVVSKVPDRSKVVPSEKQKGSNGTFRKAVRYAQKVIKDPVKSAEYKKIIPEGKSVYHAAIADYFINPKDI